MFNKKQILLSTWESASTRGRFWPAFSVNGSGSTMFTQRMSSWQIKWSQVERLGELHTGLWCRPQHVTLIIVSSTQISSTDSRVHISEKTLSFLNGEFEVEPAFGEKREEALRIAGLKTYFITKVLKPVSACWSCTNFHRCAKLSSPKLFLSQGEKEELFIHWCLFIFDSQTLFRIRLYSPAT